MCFEALELGYPFPVVEVYSYKNPLLGSDPHFDIVIGAEIEAIGVILQSPNHILVLIPQSIRVQLQKP